MSKNLLRYLLNFKIDNWDTVRYPGMLVRPWSSMSHTRIHVYVSWSGMSHTRVCLIHIQYLIPSRIRIIHKKTYRVAIEGLRVNLWWWFKTASALSRVLRGRSRWNQNPFLTVNSKLGTCHFDGFFSCSSGFYLQLYNRKIAFLVFL